jgi:hypothetical protein
MIIEFFSPGPDDDTFMELEFHNGTRMFGKFSDQFTEDNEPDGARGIKFVTYAINPQTKEVFEERLWVIPVANIAAVGRTRLSQYDTKKQLAERLELELCARSAKR